MLQSAQYQNILLLQNDTSTISVVAELMDVESMLSRC